MQVGVPGGGGADDGGAGAVAPLPQVHRHPAVNIPPAAAAPSLPPSLPPLPPRSLSRSPGRSRSLSPHFSLSPLPRPPSPQPAHRFSAPAHPPCAALAPPLTRPPFPCPEQCPPHSLAAHSPPVPFPTAAAAPGRRRRRAAAAAAIICFQLCPSAPRCVPR